MPTPKTKASPGYGLQPPSAGAAATLTPAQLAANRAALRARLDAEEAAAEEHSRATKASLQREESTGRSMHPAHVAYHKNVRKRGSAPRPDYIEGNRMPSAVRTSTTEDPDMRRRHWRSQPSR